MTDNSQETKDSIFNIRGLIHFRVIVENIKSTSTAPQCFRCLQFGHKANFCKYNYKCMFCSESHDPRTCPTKESGDLKCDLYGGGHHVSSKACPNRPQPKMIPIPPPPERIADQFPLPRRNPPQTQLSAPASNPASESVTTVLNLLTSPPVQSILSQLIILLQKMPKNPSTLAKISSTISTISALF